MVLIAPTTGIGGAEFATFHSCHNNESVCYPIHVVSAADFSSLVLTARSAPAIVQHRISACDSQLRILGRHALVGLMLAFRENRPVALCNSLAGPLAIMARAISRDCVFFYHDLFSLQSRKRKILAVLGFVGANRIVVPSLESFACVPKVFRRKVRVAKNFRGRPNLSLDSHAAIILSGIKRARSVLESGASLSIIVVGRIERNKGILELIRGLGRLPVRAVLLLGSVGDAHYYSELVETAATNKINLVNEHTTPDGVARFYGSADLCVHYSRYESTTPYAFSDAFLYGSFAFIKAAPGATSCAEPFFCIEDVEDVISRLHSSDDVLIGVIKRQLLSLFNYET